MSKLEKDILTPILVATALETLQEFTPHEHIVISCFLNEDFPKPCFENLGIASFIKDKKKKIDILKAAIEILERDDPPQTLEAYLGLNGED